MIRLLCSQYHNISFCSFPLEIWLLQISIEESSLPDSAQQTGIGQLQLFVSHLQAEWNDGTFSRFQEKIRSPASPQRSGERATRRISGDRFLMPDTTPMAMYSVTMEEPP